MAEKGIELIQNPKDEDFEDYIAAYFQAGGIYVEKSIIYRGKAELLELDIITSNFQSETIKKHLIEIKSSGWGFSEIFKVKGWMVYLGMDSGVFIIKQPREHLDFFHEKTRELGIELIDNSNLTLTGNNLKEFISQLPSEDLIESIRFSYLMERRMIKTLKLAKKNHPDVESYKRLDSYLFDINGGSFFSNHPIKRIKKLFNSFIEHKNITAKVCNELETGTYDNEATILSNGGFKKLFWRCEDTILNVALFVEHMARVTILKSCIEHLILNHKKDFNSDNFEEMLDYLSLPGTIQNGLARIVKEPFFHRYPIFWQFFTYVMGGFILIDLADQEYEYMSKNTGIPVDHIQIALDSYHKLFPAADGWMHELPHSNIVMHRFFPLPLAGVGANHRRFLYVNKESDPKQSYESLAKLLRGQNTMKDLIKWNNLGYQILK